MEEDRKNKFICLAFASQTVHVIWASQQHFHQLDEILGFLQDQNIRFANNRFSHLEESVNWWVNIRLTK